MMQGNSHRVIAAWAWLVAVAILLPPWFRVLSTPRGGVREYTMGPPIFTRPGTTNPAARWNVALDLLFIEILIITGGGLIIHRLTTSIAEPADQRASRPSGASVPGSPIGDASLAHGPVIAPDGETSRRTFRLLAFLAFGLYGSAQALPAIRLGSDWLLGGQATFMAFVGIMGSHQLPTAYWLACGMGVAANVLIVAACVGLWTRRTRLAIITSSVATALAISVLLPLAASHKLNGVHLGHLLWVGSAVLLALASGILLSRNTSRR